MPVDRNYEGALDRLIERHGSHDIFLVAQGLFNAASLASEFKIDSPASKIEFHDDAMYTRAYWEKLGESFDHEKLAVTMSRGALAIVMSDRHDRDSEKSFKTWDRHIRHSKITLQIPLTKYLTPVIWAEDVGDKGPYYLTRIPPQFDERLGHSMDILGINEYRHRTKRGSGYFEPVSVGL